MMHVTKHHKVSWTGSLHAIESQGQIVGAARQRTDHGEVGSLW